MGDGRSYASDDWTAAQWETARSRAQAWLDRDPGWIVGPSVVAMYAAGRDRALEVEAHAEHAAAH